MEVKFLDLKRIHLPYFNELEQSVLDVIQSNHYILGTSLSAFEQEYAQFSQTNYSIGVGNGLEALILSLKALKIGKGDEVILPANTFIASALAVSAVGASPVLVDPDPETFNITAATIEPKISRTTKAIMPVHLFGQSCEMNNIMKLAESCKLHVIEDNAQAQGATFNGKKTGSFGILNGTSFYPGKNLGALGDAGAITTNSSELNELVRKMRNYGSSVKYNHDVIGVNSRMDEILAGGLRVKLKYLEMQNTERQIIAKKYTEALSNISEITTPKVANLATHVYHLYVIKTKKRTELKNYLESKGIETLIHYPTPVHKQKAYEGIFNSELPISENLSEEILSLPIYPGLQDNEIHYVCETLNKFYRN